MVLSPISAAGSMRVSTAGDGIPWWVWPVLLLMLGFLVWWWLRKPAEEVSASTLSGRQEKPLTSVSPVIAESPSVSSGPKTLNHKVSREPTPKPITAESPVPSDLEEDRDQKLPVVPPIDVKPDDLSIVEGIGPRINQVLHAAGIQSLSQLSDSEISYLKEILISAGVRLADPTTWPEQARLAAVGDLETLKALQASLRGGRKV